MRSEDVWKSVCTRLSWEFLPAWIPSASRVLCIIAYSRTPKSLRVYFHPFHLAHPHPQPPVEFFLPLSIRGYISTRVIGDRRVEGYIVFKGSHGMGWGIGYPRGFRVCNPIFFPFLIFFFFFFVSLISFPPPKKKNTNYPLAPWETCAVSVLA